MDEPELPGEAPPSQPERRWRVLPRTPPPETWVATVDDRFVPGAAEPAGEVDHEFLLRHAG